MSLVHHVVRADGSVLHEAFSREAWEAAMRDPEVSGHWGHRPDECVDPLVANRERLRALGYFDGEPTRSEVPRLVSPRRSDQDRIRELEEKIARLRSGKPEQLGLGFD